MIAEEHKIKLIHQSIDMVKALVHLTKDYNVSDGNLEEAIANLHLALSDFIRAL